MIGDPFVAPVAQKTLMYVVPEALNVLDASNMSQIATLNRRCEEILSTNIDIAYTTCNNIMDEYITKVSGGAYPYDYRIYDYEWTPLEAPVTGYLTQSNKVSDLYKAIHV